MTADTVNVEVKLQDVDGMCFDATLPTGHTIVLDAGEDHGGKNLGSRPMHLLLVGLAGCTGMDVISFLRKMRRPVEGCSVKVEGVRREEHPMVNTEIKVTHIVKGDVREDRLERAARMSEETYCSAHAMLSAVA